MTVLLGVPSTPLAWIAHNQKTQKHERKDYYKPESKISIDILVIFLHHNTHRVLVIN